MIRAGLRGVKEWAFKEWDVKEGVFQMPSEGAWEISVATKRVA